MGAFYKIKNSNLQIKYPIKKQIGNVMTDVSKILPVIFLFICSFFAKDVPTIDNDFTLPVLIGIPKKEHNISVKNEPRSEQNEL